MSQGYCQGGFGLHSPVRYRNRGQVSDRHSSMSSKLASLTLNVVYVTNVLVTKRSKIIAVLTLNRERERERESQRETLSELWIPNITEVYIAAGYVLSKPVTQLSSRDFQHRSTTVTSLNMGHYSRAVNPPRTTIPSLLLPPSLYFPFSFHAVPLPSLPQSGPPNPARGPWRALRAPSAGFRADPRLFWYIFSP